MPITPLASRPHDHSHCVHSALSEADTLCAQKGLRLTALRKRVLELVWQSHKPLGAYDILAVLSEEDGRRAAPPTVYRALDYLAAQGVVHYLPSLQKYVLCPHGQHDHFSQLLICQCCGLVEESSLEETTVSVLKQQAVRHGFVLLPQFIELQGICSACKNNQ